MKAVFGMLNLNSGHVLLDGEDITALSPQARVAKGMAFVPQTNNVFTSMTVEENLEMGAFLRREGLHETQLEEWRSKAMEAAAGALKAPHGKRSEQTPERRKIRDLERELRRKNDALAEAGALLLLKKRFEEMLGDRDGSSTTRKGT